VNAIAMAPLKEQFRAAVDGVLGMETLERYTLRIDLRKRRMDFPQNHQTPIWAYEIIKKLSILRKSG
jgi:hypothetical protein